MQVELQRKSALFNDPHAIYETERFDERYSIGSKVARQLRIGRISYYNRKALRPLDIIDGVRFMRERRDIQLTRA